MGRKKGGAIRYCASDYAFLAVNTLLLGLVLLIILYPLLYVVSASVSGGVMQGSSGLSLIPAQITWEGYKSVFEYRYIWSGYRNSLVYTLLGTLVALVVTVLCAYPLSRRDFMGGKLVMALCIFTMYFGGGLIPTYIWIKQMNMLDTIWAVILPPSLSIYNMIVMRTYFRTQIPEEMREAAQLDGCGNWRFLLEIVLPLSGPILAVIGLYYAVGMWNSYFYPLIYLETRAKLPLPNILREILIMNLTTSLETSMDAATLALMEKRAEVMKYSLIIVASVPMMILYPFVQKYFVKGALIGAVKG